MADLISLIVTTWNREDALDAVLRSLATQTDRDFEVIIADDGSGEATAKLIADWASKLGHPLKHVWQEHRGFRAAEIRNHAAIVPQDQAAAAETAAAEEEKKTKSGLANVISLAQRIRALQRSGS